MELFDPSANNEVADINTVPTDFRFLYKQNGDKHVLDAENPAAKSALSIFSQMKNVLKNTTQKLRTLEGQKVDLSPLAEYGATPADILAKFTEKVEGLNGQIKGADPKKIAEGVQKEWEPKVNAANTRATKLLGQLENVLVNGEALRSLAGQTSAPELALPFIKNQVKVVEQNGEFQVHVVDENGETRFSGTNPMSIKELVAEMKTNAKYARLFDSEAPAGTGTRQQNQQRSAAAAAAAARNAAGADTSNLSPTDKIKAGLAKGQAVGTRR